VIEKHTRKEDRRNRHYKRKGTKKMKRERKLKKRRNKQGRRDKGKEERSEGKSVPVLITQCAMNTDEQVYVYLHELLISTYLL
jgi:hypothetical protein